MVVRLRRGRPAVARRDRDRRRRRRRGDELRRLLLRSIVRETDVLDELLVRRDCSHAERLDRALDSVQHARAARFREERRTDDFRDGRRAVHLRVAEDVLEHVRVRVAQSIEEDALGFGIDRLVHHSQDGLRRELVAQEVGQVGREARRDEAVAVRQVRRLDEPREQEGTVRTRRERDRVEDDRRRDAFHFESRRLCTLERLASRACSETTRANLPDSIDHAVKDEVGMGRTETEGALNDVIADCSWAKLTSDSLLEV